MTIDVKPGWKEGTKIMSSGKGDELPGRPAGDIIFVMKEQRHPRFERRGNNLIMALRINLAAALTGGSETVTTLDGRTLAINWSDPISPGFETVVKGEGMPISKQPVTKGDLIVRFEVTFPRSLKDTQKQQLRSILSGA